MTIEQRVDRLEASLGKQDELVRELRDAVTVTAHLENRQGKLLREHAEWMAQHSEQLKEHSQQLKQHSAWFAEHQAAMKELDQRIANLVSAIGALIRKQ